MGLFDNFDGNFRDIKENLFYLSQKLVDESKEIKKIAKLKYEILNEERKLKDLYANLGKYFYDDYRGVNTEIDLDEIFQEIERTNSRLSSLKMNLQVSDSSDDSGLYVEKFNKVSKNNKDDFSDTGLFITNEDKAETDESYKILTIEEDEDEF